MIFFFFKSRGKEWNIVLLYIWLSSSYVKLCISRLDEERESGCVRNMTVMNHKVAMISLFNTLILLRLHWSIHMKLSAVHLYSIIVTIQNKIKLQSILYTCFYNLFIYFFLNADVHKTVNTNSNLRNILHSSCNLLANECGLNKRNSLWLSEEAYLENLLRKENSMGFLVGRNSSHKLGLVYPLPTAFFFFLLLLFFFFNKK